MSHIEGVLIELENQLPLQENGSVQDAENPTHQRRGSWTKAFIHPDTRIPHFCEMSSNSCANSQINL